MATHFIPNAVVSVYRDDVETGVKDAWNQDVPLALPDLDAAELTDLKAYIADRGQKTRQPASGSAVVVHEYSIRLRRVAYTFRESDRIYDHTHSHEYAVDNIKDNDGVAQAVDVVLVCRRVT